MDNTVVKYIFYIFVKFLGRQYWIIATNIYKTFYSLEHQLVFFLCNSSNVVYLVFGFGSVICVGFVVLPFFFVVI